MMAQNINETVVRKIIGHKDKKMTEHYLHLDAGEFTLVTDFQKSISKDLMA